MSIWGDHDLSSKVREVLESVPLHDEPHHFGTPYMSAYQIAIELSRRYPTTVDAIGKPIGGAGIGQHNSLAQYLGNELSKQIRQQGGRHFAEGVFLSNLHVQRVTFDGIDGREISSSLVGTGFDMALFRRRVVESTGG